MIAAFFAGVGIVGFLIALSRLDDAAHGQPGAWGRYFGGCVLLLLAVLGLLLSAGCARSPVTPSVTADNPTAVTVALGGQSNAILIRPYLAERVPVVAFYGEVTTINPCWTAAGACWLALRAGLSRDVTAFVWSQGESDVIAGTPLDVYAAAQQDLFARVRSVAPHARIVVLEMGPFMINGRGGDLGHAYQRWRREWAATVGAVYIKTSDLEWQADDIHMTAQGYRDTVTRILAQVEGSF